MDKFTYISIFILGFPQSLITLINGKHISLYRGVHLVGTPAYIVGVMGIGISIYCFIKWKNELDKHFRIPKYFLVFLLTFVYFLIKYE